jgi:hypothetical protein
MSGSRIITIAAALSACLLVTQCSETTEPDPAASMVITGGNNQYSFRGTELPAPLEVQVRTAGGAVPEDAVVVFTVTAGGGSVSPGSVPADNKGVASTRLTLGNGLGTNEVVASVNGAPGVNATFTATSANYYCPEAEDSLQVCDACPGLDYGPKDDFFLFTDRSSLLPALHAGIVDVRLGGTASEFLEIPPDLGIFPVVVFDAAFSPRGDYYISRRTTHPEIVKIDTDGEMTVFASLDALGSEDQAEIDTYSYGLLVGCDITGPFVVGCSDTLLRFPEATYANAANNDAVAADPRRHTDDPLGEDIYFIHVTNRELLRLPLDSLQVEPQGLQFVAALTADEAQGARGMVCDGFDGAVYILVDTDNTKSIVKVTPGGTKTTEFDFFSRGAGDAAGVQRDLALRRPWLLTLDTLNDNLLLYEYLTVQLTPLFADSLEQAKLSDREPNGDLRSGERVGLTVLK